MSISRQQIVSSDTSNAGRTLLGPRMFGIPSAPKDSSFIWSSWTSGAPATAVGMCSLRRSPSGVGVSCGVSIAVGFERIDEQTGNSSRPAYVSGVEAKDDADTRDTHKNRSTRHSKGLRTLLALPSMNFTFVGSTWTANRKTCQAVSWLISSF